MRLIPFSRKMIASLFVSAFAVSGIWATLGTNPAHAEDASATVVIAYEGCNDFPVTLEIDLGHFGAITKSMTSKALSSVSVTPGFHSFDVPGLTYEYKLNDGPYSNPQAAPRGIRLVANDRLTIRISDPIAKPGAPLCGDNGGAMGPCSVDCVVTGTCIMPYFVEVTGRDPANQNFTKTLYSFEGGSVSSDASIPAGHYNVKVSPMRLHYPQTYRIAVVNPNGSTVATSGRFVNASSPAPIDLQAGQKILVTLENTIESYNLVFRQFRGVNTALIFNNPYLHFRTAPNEYNGTGLPNTMLELYVHGADAVADNLATIAATGLLTTGEAEYRNQHLAILFPYNSAYNVAHQAITADGALTCYEQTINITNEPVYKQLKAELKLFILDGINEILQKYYRSTNDSQVIVALGKGLDSIQDVARIHINKDDAFCKYGDQWLQYYIQSNPAQAAKQGLCPVPSSSSSSSSSSVPSSGSSTSSSSSSSSTASTSSSAYSSAASSPSAISSMSSQSSFGYSY